MNFKISTIALMMCTSFALTASEGGVISNANKNDIRYITNTKRLPDVAYQQELRERSTWKNFMSANGTWYVLFNEENAKPHRAFGQPISVFGMNAQTKAMNFITSKLSAFNIPVSELVYRNTAVSNNFQYVHYTQKHSGVKVLNSDVYVKLTPSGDVVTFGCDAFDDITIATTASISSSAAILSAQAGIIDNVTATSVNSELFILPIPEIKQNIYHLVYEVTVSTLDVSGVPAKYLTLVDAMDGKILSRTNLVKHFEPVAPPPAATDINITATVFPTNPYAPSATKPLANLQMVAASTTYNADLTGYIGLPSASPVTCTFTLQGLWSKVFTGTTNPSFTATANPGTNNFSFDASANIRELSAYYNVNIIHDYMKTKFPTFTGMDIQLPTNVDLTTGTCNAFYDGTSINFYALGGGCNSMAQIGDVVYHEYGHGINNTYYQSLSASFGNGAMDEGYADTWALGVTVNPVLGIGMDDTDPTVFVRRYDIGKKVYPQDLVGEVHADGEIIAGCWWDTGENFADHQAMMDLYKETFNATLSAPDGSEGVLYTDVLIEALTDDDIPANGGDNNISNGTPNDIAIVDAFAIHGITLLSNAVVTHTAVLSSAALATIPINATISVTYPWAFLDAKVFYKLNRSGAWTSMVMTNTTGINYTANIPAQPAGTVIGYYIGLESTVGTPGQLSAVQPFSAADANPNIPYFILNGVNLMQQEDFDDNFGGWSFGIPSDNATTGMWEVAAPIASYSTPSDPSTICAPGTQHTVGGIYCAVTQNAPNATAALGTADIDNGETTCESPIYNLSTYTNPIFAYYRWYINNPPTGANPGNDTWEVQISNDGTNWVKVERTSVSDKSWRRYAFRVLDYLPLSSTVSVRFVAEDSLTSALPFPDNGQSIVEAALDDLYLYEETASGVDENSSVNAVNVFPNPASNLLNITYELSSTDDVTIEMTNALSQVVYTEKVSSNSLGKHVLKIDTNAFSEGMYMVNIKTAKKNHIQKVAIMK